MPQQIRFVDGGTVTTPKGFSAGATYAGLKTYAEDKLDLGLLLSERPSEIAGMFTTSSVKSPSLRLTQQRVAAAGKARALVVNSGIANACVGEQGFADAQEATAQTAKRLDLEPEEVLIGSTGIIGVELPMALIRAGIAKIDLSEDGGHELARAILTTDTHPKEAAVAFEHGGKTVTIGGIAKGAGMIHPNMATMLCFLTTDAEVERAFLQKSLKQAVDSSLNMLSVDGDSSTNDTVLIYSNGCADTGVIAEGSAAATTFQTALNQLCVHLTKELARDGEGATKLIEVHRRESDHGRCSPRGRPDCSLLEPRKVRGPRGGPNWGRILAALGRSGAEVDESKIALYVNDVCIMDDGRPVPFHKDGVVALMQGDEVSFRILLNTGQSSATAWGCNLSEEYVTFNSAYTT